MTRRDWVIYAVTSAAVTIAILAGQIVNAVVDALHRE